MAQALAGSSAQRPHEADAAHTVAIEGRAQALFSAVRLNGGATKATGR